MLIIVNARSIKLLAMAWTGHMTDAELEAKFSEMALDHFSQSQVDELISTIWNAEKLSNMSQLTDMLKFPG